MSSERFTELPQDVNPAMAHGAEWGSQDTITLDLQLSPGQVSTLLDERVPYTDIQPNLVLPSEVTHPELYERLKRQQEKDEYRKTLQTGLATAWEAQYGPEKAGQLNGRFSHLADTIERDGALVIGDMIDRNAFAGLVDAYDGLIDKHGSGSLLHSYVNLRSHPDFLVDSRFNRAFFHPLAIALISRQVGGAVRIVDARAKDAGPVSAHAQDNMLHVDENGAMRSGSEMKVNLSWEKGQPSGPKGQNFTFLPGTHQGLRQSQEGPNGPYFTEADSVFRTPESIAQVFALQREVRGGQDTVSEMTDPNRPLSAIFVASDLVHQRYRTEEGKPRSGLIMAFHPTAGVTGEYVDNYDPIDRENLTLEESLFGIHNGDPDAEFTEMLTRYASEIAEKVDEVFEANQVIYADERALTLDGMKAWYKAATEAPTVEEIKREAAYFPLGTELGREDFMGFLASDMMRHDKHASIYMILYPDGHEAVRKWARNANREMRMDVLQPRLQEWQDEIKQPAVEDLLSQEQFKAITERLLHNAASVTPEMRRRGHLDEGERISPTEAYQSVEQLIADLAENFSRADSRQTYLTLSLFQFWACDMLNRLKGNNDAELREVGGQLLRNYITAAVLVEKQIANENGGVAVRR
jgi:hypothetical protein